MRIILLKNLIFFIFLFSHASYSMSSEFRVCFDTHTCVETKESEVKKTSIDNRIEDFLEKAEYFRLIPDTIKYVNGIYYSVGIIRAKSNPDSPEKFCGAGYEDYLVFLEFNEKTLNLLDNIIIQSCLNSISLISDAGDDPEKSIKAKSSPISIYYEASSPPDFKLKKYRITISNFNFKKEIVNYFP